ncbi:hypothetical protein GCM10010399_60190 [Dactylosporangium fulvum]|uniref:RICIN domain-containing protein n=1 Tax=Dactylosporangium fulvum TaxID=53359 RepID=A0ABY5VW70_9ACTN|nr:RICIN domain-containing protein [Dactylosporangium fulvum]UWP80036.1 RICIN domain-containing protein [Dactylosporangium fulvum]
MQRLRSLASAALVAAMVATGLLVLSVPRAAQAAGAQVVQWNPNGGTNQQWQLVPATAGDLPE